MVVVMVLVLAGDLNFDGFHARPFFATYGRLWAPQGVVHFSSALGGPVFGSVFQYR